MTRTIIITGASDGIGAASARQLHEAGEQVIVVGRDPDKTAAVAKRLDVPSHVEDFADLAQVRELAETLLQQYPRIDVLANNAGGVFGERTETRDGYELTFQVNHLAPFLLTNLLVERLRTSQASVIQTSSQAQRFSRFAIDDLQARRRYSAGRAYGNSKLANVLFTKELHRRFGEAGVSAVSFNPGAVATGFAAAARGPWRMLYQNDLFNRILDGTDVGGSKLTWMAMGKPGFDWERGGYYVNNRLARPHRDAEDPALARALWDRSAELVGL